MSTAGPPQGTRTEGEAAGIPVTAPVTIGTLPAVLAQLFRHSLREGRVHPLLHAVQRYRHEVPR